MALGLTFAFDPSKGDTPESVARKRALIAQIMGTGPVVAPRNTWDGVGNAFASIAGGIAARNLNKQADATTQAGLDSAASDWGGLMPQSFPGAPGASGAVDSVPAGDVPANWENIRAGIFKGESGGDYDALFGFSNRPGKQFADTKITDMTVDQALAFADPSGPYAQWVKKKIGRVATPMGAYQAVGSTLGLAKKGLGLTGNERMSPEMQDRIGQWILANQGTKAWAGYRGPVAASPAVAAVGAAATGQPVPPAPVQVASLDPSAGVAEATAPADRPMPAEYAATGMSPETWARMNATTGGSPSPVPTAKASPIPMQPGPLPNASPQQSAFVDRMTSPQPMGGQPMPLMPSPQVAQAAPPSPFVPKVQDGHDLSRIPVTAGGNAGVSTPGQGPSLQMLMQAAANPWLNDSQKAVINMMIKQQMAGGEQNDFQQRASAAAQYGLDPNSEEGRNFILTGKLPEQRGGAAELGLNPQYGVDEKGNPVLLQLGKDGKVVRSALPEGVHLSKEPIKVDLGTSWGLIDPITRQVIGNVPKDLKGAAEDAELGKQQAALRASLPSDMLNTRQAISDIDALIDNKGLDSIVGGLDQYRPSWMLGNQGRDAAARLNQIKGKTFLQAYATLKGGGAITEVEGKKAEDAIGRLDRAQDEKTFRAALSDLRDVIAEGQRVMLDKAGIPKDQWGKYLGPDDAGGNTGNDWQDVGGVKIRRKQ